MNSVEYDLEMLGLWGADDCYFFEEELCEWFGKTKEEFRLWLKKMEETYPVQYHDGNRNRQTMARQNRFEKRNRLCSSDLLDSGCVWGMNDSSHVNNTNTQSMLQNRAKPVETDE